MSETSQLITAVAVLAAAAIVAIGVVLVTLGRVRTPEKRRDMWLSANGQSRATAAGYIAIAATSTVAGLVCVVLALIYGNLMLWAPAVLSVGTLASTAIYASVSSRMPRDWMDS